MHCQAIQLSREGSFEPRAITWYPIHTYLRVWDGLALFQGDGRCDAPLILDKEVLEAEQPCLPRHDRRLAPRLEGGGSGITGGL